MELEQMVLQSVKMKHKYIMKKGQIIFCSQSCKMAQSQTYLENPRPGMSKDGMCTVSMKITILLVN